MQACCGEMTIVGAAALAAVSGWLFGTVLPPRPSVASLAGIAAGIAAVVAETMLIGGTTAGLVALAGIVGGGALQSTWLRTLRRRARALPQESSA